MAAGYLHNKSSLDDCPNRKKSDGGQRLKETTAAVIRIHGIVAK
jgi:hypothetical protein